MPSLKPVGTIVAVRAPSHYKLSRLAVLKDHRRCSFGRALVLGFHDWVRSDAITNGQNGEVKIRAHSQLQVKGFYAKQVHGGWFKSNPPLTITPRRYGYIPEVIVFRARYERYSTEIQGDEFDEDGVPHQLMVATIKLD